MLQYGHTEESSGNTDEVVTMKADAVIFDKDGTLIDFDSFWIPVSVKVIEDILCAIGQTEIPAEEILTAFGVKDGVTDITGVLCHGTYAQLGETMYEVLLRHGCPVSCDDIIRMVTDGYAANLDAGEIKPSSPDLADALKELRRRNIKLAVVTNDNPPVTLACLRAIGIDELFDRIYTDDGSLPHKPDPAYADDFCRRMGLDKKHVIMVGDTLTDMKFAKNAGIIAVGVAEAAHNREILAPYADTVTVNAAAVLGLLDD